MRGEYTPPPSDRGQLPALLIALVAGGWLLLVVVSLLAARWWEVRSRPASRAGPSPVMGHREVADVNQSPFALDDKATRLRGEQRSRLDGYGWVDRDAGLIHLPVERAMEQVLAEEGAGP